MKKAHSRRRARRRKAKRSGTPARAIPPTRREEAEQTSLPTELHQILLTPGVRKAIAAAKAANTSLEKRKIDPHDTSRERITAWLRGGARFDELGRLLSDLPILVWHPLVQTQLRRLWMFPSSEKDRLLAFWAFFASGSSADAGSPPGRRVARNELRKIVELWVQGVLGSGWSLKPPGWSLKPPPERPGPKRTTRDISWDYFLKASYDEILGRLKQHDPIRPTQAESTDGWLHRLCQIISNVWQDSSLSSDTSYEAHASAPDPWFDILGVERQIPVPVESVKRWALEMRDLEAEGPIRDRLAYRMIADRWNLTPHYVRGRVQAARRDESSSAE